jgi:hypothetical protein
MIVIKPGGEEVVLGITEATPTVSIMDFSRRVTDEFGVTTVVKRGFSRRLSLRMALPFEEVDGLQQTLTALRATAATWVADDRFTWLSPVGFYKDFEADLGVPPLSFCTLTIEGIAESEPGADFDEDPAPAGSVSTLQLIQPIDIDPDVLVSSSVAETPEWSAVPTYPAGARVVLAATHRTYESLEDGNLNHHPTAEGSPWLDVGPSNRWAMFDQALGTATTATGTITVVLDGDGVDALALLDVVAASVRVQATGFDQTESAASGMVTFLGLPEPAGNITVTIAGAGEVSVGTLVAGHLVGLGITEASPTAGIIDYSLKETDDFGEVTVVERAWAKRMSTRALIRTAALDTVANRIAAVRGQPSLWLGDAGLDTLTIYGFFKEFSIEVGENVSTVVLSIEGLSRAAPQNTIDRGIESYWQAAAPTGAADGDLWFDTDDGNKQYRYDGTTWQVAQDNTIGLAIAAAADAQATADGKAATFIGESTPTAEGIGDLWFRPSTGFLMRWNGATWVDISNLGATPAQVSAIAAALTAAENAQDTADGKIDTFYQASPPTGSIGDLWFDIDDGNKQYRHNGTTWAVVQDGSIGLAISAAAGAQATADGKVTTYSGESTPTATALGDLWFKPSTGVLKRWSGSTWVDVSNLGATAAQIASISAALTAAENAQATADGKIETFYQASAPSGTVGDLWFDTDDSNKQYRHNGSGWVQVRDGGIGAAISAAAGAQATADGKVTTFVGETNPTPQGVGDLWFKPSTGFLARWNGSTWTDVANIGGFGMNAVINADGSRGTYGWAGRKVTGGVPDVGIGLNLTIGGTNYWGRRNVFYSSGGVMSSSEYVDVCPLSNWSAGVATAASLSDLRAFGLKVKLGERLAISALVSCHRSTAYLYLLIMRKDGTLREAPGLPTGYTTLGGVDGDNLGQMAFFHQVTEADADYAIPMIRYYGTGDPASAVMFFSEPYLTKVVPGQTLFPPYTPGRGDVTADNQYTLDRTPDIDIMCDYFGNPLPGQLPINMYWRYYRGKELVGFESTYDRATYGCTIVLDALNIWLTDVSVDQASITHAITHNGYTSRDTLKIRKIRGAPRVAGGSGATTFSSTVSGEVSETSFDSTPHVLAQGSCVANGSGNVHVQGNVAYDVVSTVYGGSFVNFTGYFKVQVSGNGGASWIDTLIGGSGTEAFFDIDPYTNNFGYAQGTYACDDTVALGGVNAGLLFHFRLLAIKSSGSANGAMSGSFGGNTP